MPIACRGLRDSGTGPVVRTVLDVMDTNGSGVAGADQGSMSSRMAAHVLTGLLIADIVGAATRLTVPSILSRNDTPIQVEMDLKPIVVLSRIVFAATVVVFLVWFLDPRLSAEQSTWPQRRARSWVFWGWVVPIADLWIPFQIMGDIWRAHLPAGRRGKLAWLPLVWWTSWLATGILTWASADSSNTGYGLQLAHNWWGFSLFAIAASALGTIIQTVSHQKREHT